MEKERSELRKKGRIVHICGSDVTYWIGMAFQSSNFLLVCVPRTLVSGEQKPEEDDEDGEQSTTDDGTDDGWEGWVRGSGGGSSWHGGG